MPGVALSRRVSKAVAYPPLCEMSAEQRREFQAALLEADAFEDLRGKVAGGDPDGRTETADAAGRKRRLRPPLLRSGVSGVSGRSSRPLQPIGQRGCASGCRNRP